MVSSLVQSFIFLSLVLIILSEQTASTCHSSAEVRTVKGSFDRCACMLGPSTLCLSKDPANCHRAHRTVKNVSKGKPVFNLQTQLFAEEGIVEGFLPDCEDCTCAAPCLKGIFIVGCGHSGTTYLVNLIGKHPDYHMLNVETGWFAYKEEKMEKSIAKHAAVCGRARKLKLVEKTAEHIMHMEKLFYTFPDAQVIYITRDGRDVSFSNADRYLKIGKVDPAEITSRWTRANKNGIKLLDNPQVHWVKYEDLIETPEKTLHKLFQFLEGTDAPKVVLSAITQGSESTWGRIKPVLGKNNTPDAHGYKNIEYRNWQINQPIFDGRGRWKKLSDSDLKAMYSKGQFLAMMQKLGYLDPQNETQWYDRS